LGKSNAPFHDLLRCFGGKSLKSQLQGVVFLLVSL